MSEEKNRYDDEQKTYDIEDIELDDADVLDEPVKRPESKKKATPTNWPVMKTGKPAEVKLGDKSLDIPAFERREKKEAERTLAPKRSTEPTFLEEYGRYIVIGAVSLILVIALVVGGINLFKKDKPSDHESSTPEQTSASAESTEPSTEAPKDTSLKTGVVPGLDTLMERYYDALIACDLSEIYNIVEDDSAYSLENLQKQSEYIEDYLNITCHTKPGLYDGEYVLYVYSEIKFLSIDTPAPQLNHYYVNRTADGGYRLANGMLDSDKVAYMNTVDDDDDVRALIDDVYAKLTSAMMNDEKLNNLVQMLNNVPDETEPEPETEPQPGDSETFYVDGELFYRVNETVYPKEEVRVRAKNSLESDVVGVLTVSDYVTRTGYSEEWSQIVYNGFTAYVYKGFLTTNKPE